MTAPRTPMRWPRSWNSPSALELLNGTSIDTLLIDNSDEFEPVRAAAEQRGLHVVHPDTPPEGVSLIKGEWPGVRSMDHGDGAGPTGVPWVDSNGWSIRLEQVLKPGAAVWVDAPPKGNPRYGPGSYLIAITDAGARGGRWVITLDDALAGGLTKQDSYALKTWQSIVAASAFFPEHQAWDAYVPQAISAVVSDFTGSNEFFSRELLNLLERAGMHYRIVPKGKLTAADLAGLHAVIYADDIPPADGVRRQVSEFVARGGMLITVPKWGAPAGPKADEHPRYDIRASGKGRIATLREEAGDPYEMAQDAPVLVSHRYDLVRFWNGGATGSHYTALPDRSRAVVHLLFYADRGPNEASVRIVGRYRSVKAWTPGSPEIPHVEMVSQKDAVEVRLPQVPQYVALEFQA